MHIINHNAWNSVWHFFFILLRNLWNFKLNSIYEVSLSSFLVLKNPSVCTLYIYQFKYKFHENIISSEPFKMPMCSESIKYINLFSCSLNGKNMIGNIVHWFFFFRKKKNIAKPLDSYVLRCLRQVSSHPKIFNKVLII